MYTTRGNLFVALALHANSTPSLRVSDHREDNARDYKRKPGDVLNSAPCVPYAPRRWANSCSLLRVCSPNAFAISRFSRFPDDRGPCPRRPETSGPFVIANCARATTRVEPFAFESARSSASSRERGGPITLMRFVRSVGRRLGRKSIRARGDVPHGRSESSKLNCTVL